MIIFIPDIDTFLGDCFQEADWKSCSVERVGLVAST